MLKMFSMVFDMIQNMGNDAVLFEMLFDAGGFWLVLKHWSFINLTNLLFLFHFRLYFPLFYFLLLFSFWSLLRVVIAVIQTCINLALNCCCVSAAVHYKDSCFVQTCWEVQMRLVFLNSLVKIWFCGDLFSCGFRHSLMYTFLDWLVNDLMNMIVNL